MKGDCEKFVNSADTQDQSLPSYVDFYFRCKSFPHFIEAYTKVLIEDGLRYRKLIHVYQDGTISEFGYSIENQNFTSIDSREDIRYFTVVTPLGIRELKKIYLDKIAPTIDCFKNEKCSRKLFESAGIFYRLFDEHYKGFVADYKLNDFNAFSYDVFNSFRIDDEFFSFDFIGKNNREWSIELELWEGKVKLRNVFRVL